MKVHQEGRTLIIEIDLDAIQQITGNGNIMIAGTNGWRKLGNNTSLTLAVVKKPA